MVDVKLGLAWGYLLQNDRDAAERELRSAIEAEPEQANLHDELIDVLASAGKFDEAIVAADLKFETVGVSPSDRLQRVGLLMRAGRGDEAREELVRSREQAESDEDVSMLVSLGTTYVVMGDVDAALSLIEQAVSLSPEDAEARFKLAELRVRRGEYDLAIEEYRACIELDPEIPEVRYNLGALLRRLGMFDGAVEQLERTLALAPQDLATQIELGFAYAAAGREVDALEILRRASAQHPESPEVQLHLPMVISDLEQRVSATH
jgi:tetratricopeptide (TPR) repeat protein